MSEDAPTKTPDWWETASCNGSQLYVGQVHAISAESGEWADSTVCGHKIAGWWDIGAPIGRHSMPSCQKCYRAAIRAGFEDEFMEERLRSFEELRKLRKANKQSA